MLINKINKFLKSKLYCKVHSLLFSLLLTKLVKELLFVNTKPSIEPYNQMKKGKNNKKKT